MDGCEFITNTASSQGGAIFAAGSTNITGTKFEGNEAKTAGALYVSGSAKVTDSEFISNEATGNGGAIFFYAGPDGSGTLKITDNTNFTENTAGGAGGAILVHNGVVNITDATFKDNTATNTGAAIQVRADAETTIEDSNFTDNGESTDYAVYNLGTLSLKGNRVSNLIYSSAEIKTSTINATLIEGLTIPAELGEVVTPNATLVDDMGNAIYDPNFVITVNGENATEMTYDFTNKIYAGKYTIVKAGENIVSTNYQYATHIETGIYDVDKANVTSFIVDVRDIVDGDNATVAITLVGVNDVGLNATVTVYINNKPITITVENGSGSQIIEDLEPKHYPVVAIFEDIDGNYNTAINSTAFNVKSTQADLSVEIQDSVYGDTITITATLCDDEGNPLTGIVKVSFADNDYYVAVIDGEGSYVVTDKLDVNTYDYVATFESELYNTTTYTDSFDVMQRAVYIYVNNDDGVGVGQVGRIKVVLLDEHNNVIVDEVELIFTDENGDEVNRTVITTSNELWGPVDSRDLEFTKDWSIGTYYVTVVSPNYSFMKLPDEEAPAVYEFTSYADAEGNEVWGTGTVEVIGEAEDGFIPVKVLSNTFDDEFVGKTFYIQEDAEADGTIYQLYIINDDDEYEAIQNVYVSVSEAEPEIWDPVTVEYPVHKNYIEAEVTDGDGEFVYGMEHIVTIELVGYDEDEHRYLVEITCPATVYILKYDEEEDQYLIFGDAREDEFEDGVLSIDLSDLPVGEYKLMVSIDDENYQLCTWLYDEVLEEDIQLDYALLYRDDKLFWVNEDNVFLENINGTDWTNYGDGRNFSFELWHNDELFEYSTIANVTVYSIVRDDDGNIISMTPVHTYESVAITDGISEIIDLSYLNAGEYKVTVALIDDHYVLHGWDGDAPVIYAFTSYDEDGEEWGTGTVQIIGGAEDGFIPVEVLSNSYDDEFVGKIFYIQEDAQEDDLIQLYMMNDNNEIVAVDLWVKVSKQSDEDVDYYCEYFNVDRAGVEVQIDVTDPITYGENETVTITVVTPTGEKLNETVEVNVMGKETFYQTLVNGTVTFNLTGYDVGTYTIWVNFFGTENYAELWNSIAGFTVGKATPQVSVEDVEIPYGNDAVINVAVTGVDDEAVEGTVIVTVNGVEYIVKDGKVTVPAGLASDVYDITARFTGNDNYNEATNDTAKLNITASEVTVVTISVTNVTYGDEPMVTITLKDGEGKDKSGSVLITISDLSAYPVTVDGVYTYSLGLTDVGSYNITASIDGVNDTAFYTVSKSSNAAVEVVPNDPSYGEAANITVSAFDGTTPIAGNAYVAVDGTPLDGVFPIDGATVIDLGTALTAGVHTIEVEFVNDNYETVNKFTSITVGKATPEIVITDIAGNVGDTVEANVTIAGGDATGYIFYGGEAYIVKDGKATIQVKILTSGIQTITVTYTGDDNYRNGTGNKAFNAGKGTINSISTDIDNNTEYTAGIDLPVEVSVDPAVSGEYTVWIDGVEATDYGPFTVENGQGSFIILAEDLPAGEHNITVQFKEDTFYHASENVTYVFSVVKSDISIETDIVNGTEFTAGDNVNVAVDVTPAVSGTYTLWIDGKPVSDYGTLTVYNGEGGFTILAEDLTAGEHNITVQFNENELYYASENATYVFSVVKSDVSIETDIVNGTEFTAGEDLNVAVDVTPAVSGEYTLWIDGKPVSDYGILTVYNGEGSFIILAEDLTVGKHNITVQFNENELYHASENVTYVFNVVTSTSISTDIVNGTTVAAGEDLTVNVSVDPAVNGTYTLWIDGVEATDYLSLNVNNGKGGFIILAKDVTAGYHTVSVQFNGDELYKQSEKVTYTFTAAKKDSIITITTGDVVIDTPLDVTINIGNLTGDVTVTGGAYEGTVALTNGEGSFTIPKENMTAGPKTIVVIVSDNAQYADNSSSYTFTVEKAENYTFEVNITVSEITVADDVTFNVTLPGDANGIVYVSVDGTPVTFEPVVNGNATVTIPASAFTGGRNNTIEVTYEDSGDKYANATVTKEIYVSKLPYELTATAKNVELGQNVTIVVKLPEGADGRAYASLQGNIYFADGDVITIENLTEGSYTAYVVFIYDSRYEDNQTKVEFNVTKVSVPADVAFSVNTPENATAPEVTVTLPEDATGFLLVDVDGAQTFVPLVNGTATARIPDGLTAGNYTAEITYTGDNKYAPITTTKEITVASNVPDNAFTIPENSTTDSPTYSISLPGDAGGYLEVDVDGTKYIAPLVNGSASITVPGLSEGKHNVTVTYSGDGKYSKVVKSNTLDVKLPVPVYKITNNKDVKVIYSAKATYKVLVTKDGKAVGAGESVVITFNGKKYTVKTDKNGYATLNLNTKVKVKTYTVTAEYNGVKVTNKVKVQHVIKASNKKVKKSRKVTKVKITLKKVNGKVLKKKTLKIKFRGKTYKVKTNKKGVAYWKVKKSMLKRTTVGKKYKYRITYGKDVLTKRLIVKR